MISNIYVHISLALYSNFIATIKHTVPGMVNGKTVRRARHLQLDKKK